MVCCNEKEGKAKAGRLAFDLTILVTLKKGTTMYKTPFHSSLFLKGIPYREEESLTSAMLPYLPFVAEMSIVRVKSPLGY